MARISSGASEMFVLARHDDQAGTMGRRIEGRPGKSKPEGVGPGLRDRLVQLLLQIAEEIRLGHFEPTWIPCLRERMIELVMGDPAHIVEVQSVSRIVWSGDVGMGPVCSGLEIEQRIGVWQTCRQVATRQCKVQLRRPKLQVVSPLSLGIKAVGGDREQIATGAGVRQGENVLCRKQVLVRVGRVAGLEDLETEREVGRQATGKVRADERSGGGNAKHRAVTDVAVQRVGPAIVVVRLRQAPYIVIPNSLGIPRPDAHLVVEYLGRVIPHVLEPIETELRLSSEVRSG